MSIKKSICSKLIRNFQLRELFNELGWNHTAKKEQVVVDSLTYQLEAIGEKSAFFVFVCETADRVPDYTTRKKIDSVVTKLYNQHLIIYTYSNKRQQIWQLVVKELDKPAVVRETLYFSTQEPELLFQKLQHLFFSIDEEDNITVVDVTGRVRTGFNTNADKITKKFYDGFKKEHTAFLAFIKGISSSQDKEWYASLMLNRLMFIYFIQKKGFLNNDKFYLKTKLAETQSHKGKDEFYSFYRNFLLILFHQGLGSPDNKQHEKELGKVPYLNGGLFDVHELENNYTAIKIEDTAFERIFAFFDQYEWLLDTRQQATGKEINPDVIGYIFEKYINDRAAMGAYYTKEDITDYIGKNCIIPFLFDELKRHYPHGLKKGGDVWSLLQQYPADYIYPAVRHGVELELPPEIAKGVDDVGKREEWNKSAPGEYALPTEIWREVVERRRRYAEVKGKIEAGEIHEINDLITYNLNITKFAIDVIQNSADSELIRHFYKILERITILDPTCGSGAFLFAAMNILEPLYEACLARMRAFVDEASPGKFKAFDGVLKRMDAPEHPNHQYFIFKSIILNNLFGVDIMKEAIEIAKLRLFLKLVATVDVDHKKPNMGLEPLPDIDFNIRSGNTLVGFVSIGEVKKSVEGELGFHDSDIASIEEAADFVKRAFSAFREAQIENDSTKKGAKKELTDRLHKLNDRLDVYLGKLYGKNPKKATEYKAWHHSHTPFHWFAEFYEIVHDRGGFDVIIGNPPYVEYKKVENQYKILNYKTEPCSDLYAFVMERSQAMLLELGRFGMIVPISIASTDGFSSLRCVFTHNFWCLNFAERPAKLFTGVEKRLTIFLCSNNSAIKKQMLCKYIRWNAEEREILFENIRFVLSENTMSLVNTAIPKVGCSIEKNILDKISSNRQLLNYYLKSSKHVIYYTRKLRYFVQFFDFVTKITNSIGESLEPSELKSIYVDNDILKGSVISILNSNLFFWFFNAYSDVRNVNRRELEFFPCSLEKIVPELSTQLGKFTKELMIDFSNNAKHLTADYGKHGILTIQSFQPRLSKPIIDKIDTVLAKHYGFTDEELDFIINYDIKYRMGKGAGEEDGDE